MGPVRAGKGLGGGCCSGGLGDLLSFVGWRRQDRQAAGNRVLYEVEDILMRLPALEIHGAEQMHPDCVLAPLSERLPW